MTRVTNSTSSARPRRAASAQVQSPPPFRPVQLAQLVDTVPTGDRWLHEMKYDGYRTLIAVGGGEGRAYTRSGLDWSDRFGGILDDARKLKVNSALIDGEAVVMDADGRSSFQALQGALKGAPGTIDYVAFDLLALDGEDLAGLPLTERKAKLREILPDGETIAYLNSVGGTSISPSSPVSSPTAPPSLFVVQRAASAQRSAPPEREASSSLFAVRKVAP